jgi:hypothetical protein
MQTMNLPKFVQPILKARRRLRINHALSKIAIRQDMKIIDIGCGIDGRSFEDFIPPEWKITGVDLHNKERINHSHPNFVYFKGDASDLSQFGNNEFDLAISIGMLEHITKKSAFESVVSNIRRVAKQYIVIVPYKYALIEPHYGVPFFPIIPYSIKLKIIKLLNLSNHREAVKNDSQYVNKHFMWLSNSEYRSHFPGSIVYIAPTMDTIAIVHKDASL